MTADRVECSKGLDMLERLLPEVWLAVSQTTQKSTSSKSLAQSRVFIPHCQHVALKQRIMCFSGHRIVLRLGVRHYTTGEPALGTRCRFCIGYRHF